jgi:hypothetical protein
VGQTSATASTISNGAGKRSRIGTREALVTGAIGTATMRRRISTASSPAIRTTPRSAGEVAEAMATIVVRESLHPIMS